jgi:hypothetical protein
MSSMQDWAEEQRIMLDVSTDMGNDLMDILKERRELNKVICKARSAYLRLRKLEDVLGHLKKYASELTEE